MPALGDIVNTSRGEGIVSALVGGPLGEPLYIVLLKDRNEHTGTPSYWQLPASEMSPGRAHPTYVVGQRVGYHGRGGEITAIAEDLTITVSIDNPQEGDNPLQWNTRAELPHWRLTMIEQFQT